MDIKLVSGTYKSITSLQWNDIPDFVVVTGKNGSGKTQLLELINYHTSNNVRQKQQIQSTASSPFFGVEVTIENFELTEKEIVYLPATWNMGDLGGINSSNFTDAINHLHQQIAGRNKNEAYQELATIVEAKIGKQKQDITLSDVQSNLPVDFYDYINKIQLHEGLNEAVYGYHCKYWEYIDEGMSHEEIVNLAGEAPWDLINRLLESANFPYTIKKPKGFRGNYFLHLKSSADQSIELNFSDLSSGEKILISLGIWMFNASTNKRLPKLLLLDEPDAHLHPSAIKDFLEVIENTLVKEHGVKVIITTHSPTTVSLSPEYSLFEMSKTPPQMQQLQSKEYGINLLTNGLVIVKSNTKYVLVEDKDDAKFYNTVFSILKNKNVLNENISILFIPASNREINSSGGCTVVKSWLEKFVNDGVFDVFQGLIDRDVGGQSPISNMHIINRYSMENYLLDPIMVCSSLFHLDTSFNIPNINIDHRTEHKISELDVGQLQIMADYIFSEISPTIPNLTPPDAELQVVEFTKGVKLNYPSWFLNYRGHDLYSYFRAKFNNAVNHDNLIRALIRRELIPLDMKTIFSEIQNSV